MSPVLSRGRFGLLAGLGCAAAAVLSFSSPSLAVAGRQVLPADIEATLDGGNAATNSIQALGLNINLGLVTMRTPGGLAITAAGALGAPLPGRTQPGYVGGTVFATLDPTVGPGGVNAQSVTLTVPETVLIGPVTDNSPGTNVAGRNISVLGVPVRAAVDARLDPFQAVIGAFPVDIASIPVGSTAAVEGYLGSDGFFYAQILDAEQGTPIGGVTVAFGQSKCSGGSLEVRGTVSVFSGNIQLLDPAGVVIGTSPVSTLDGTWRIRARLATCPANVRARHVETGFVSAPFVPPTR